MASLVKENDSWRIRFYERKKRQEIFLGKINKKMAETIHSQVEQIISCNKAGVSYPPFVAQWLGTIDDDLHEKLSKVGLIEKRTSRTLKTFLDDYIRERTDLKERTRQKYGTSINHLKHFFGNIFLKDVAEEKAAQYRAYLVGTGLKTATVSKMIGIARLFFNVALRRKLVDDNPFQYVETGSQVNKEREYYVSENETQALLSGCFNARSKLIIALGRYAGLRVPSELVGLRWSEVNWETGRFIVHSPKTARKGKDRRIVPIFGNLLPYLRNAFEQSPEGEDRIFPNIHPKKSMSTWIAKLAKRVSLPLWEKPFQNMRASCATDLMEIFPSYICAEWLGHTEKVADKHYRQVLDSHFEKAQNPYPFGTGATGNDPLLPVQNPDSLRAKSVPAGVRKRSQNKAAVNISAVNCGVLQNGAMPCKVKNRPGRT